MSRLEATRAMAPPGGERGQQPGQGQEQGQVATRTRSSRKLKQPRLYKVLLHNDDYTPREFVVLLLQHVFHLSESDATRLMLYVHNNGVGVIGLFTYAIAETKVAEVKAAAEQANLPLLCTMEPEGEDGDRQGDRS